MQLSIQLDCGCRLTVFVGPLIDLPIGLALHERIAAVHDAHRCPPDPSEEP